MPARHAPDSLANNDRDECVHTLRNLFAVTASAARLIREARDAGQRDYLLDVIEKTAARGGLLTSSLLTNNMTLARSRLCDVNQHLRSLLTQFLVLAGDRIHVDIHLASEPMIIRAPCHSFEAVILELVRNACAAIKLHGRITIKSLLAGDRVWVMVADNGAGISPAKRKQLIEGTPTISHARHGHGFNQVRRFVEKRHGHLHLRSRAGRGTVVAISLPASPATEDSGHNRKGD